MVDKALGHACPRAPGLVAEWRRGRRQDSR